jgi:sugar lactone lactonase YvrE
MSNTFSLDPSVLEPFGSGLRRPECVMPLAAGGVLVPNWDGGATYIAPNGQPRHVLAAAMRELRPNGVSLDADGRAIIANLGDDGGVWRLGPNGDIEAWVQEVAGRPLPPTNFAIADPHERVWVSISTRDFPRHLAWRPNVLNGFIVVIDRSGPRIVADGLHYANEVRPDPSGTWLYAIETFGRRLSRFPIRPGNELGPRETVLRLPPTNFPDGFTFDEDDGIWITSLISNRLLRFHEDRLTTVLEDVNPTFVIEAETAFAEGRLAREHLGPIPGTRLQQLTSIAFGGPDLHTAYLGSLHASCLYRFRAPVRGVPPPFSERGSWADLN